MPVATPDQYAEMLDRAKAGGFAYPAFNVSSSQTINSVLQGLTEAGSDGIIQVIEMTAEGIGRNASELLRKVKAAQYVRSHPGEVCPAKWEEGQKTLAPSLDLVGKI